MPGPLPTPAENRLRRNSPSSGVWHPPLEPLCDPPSGLLPETQADWHEFWTTPEAGGVTTGSLPALRRLFVLRDQAARAWAGYDDEPMQEGSKGQQVLNPLGRQAIAIEQQIARLEDDFGLTPRARLRLNVTLAESAEAIERTAAAVARLSEAEEQAQRADPRLTDPAAAAADARAAGGSVDGGEPRPR